MNDLEENNFIISKDGVWNDVRDNNGNFRNIFLVIGVVLCIW